MATVEGLLPGRKLLIYAIWLQFSKRERNMLESCQKPIRHAFSKLPLKGHQLELLSLVVWPPTMPRVKVRFPRQQMLQIMSRNVKCSDLPHPSRWSRLTPGWSPCRGPTVATACSVLVSWWTMHNEIAIARRKYLNKKLVISSSSACRRKTKQNWNFRRVSRWTRKETKTFSFHRREAFSSPSSDFSKVCAVYFLLSRRGFAFMLPTTKVAFNSDSTLKLRTAPRLLLIIRDKP